MTTWIPVTERLPDPDEVVICYANIDYLDEAKFEVQPGKYRTWTSRPTWESMEWDGFGGYEDFRRVTHWMPLPAPPVLTEPK